MKQMKSRAKQAGAALLEYTVYAAIVGMAIIAVYEWYARNQTTKESELMRDSLVSFYTKVTAVKQQWGHYNGYSNTSVWQSDELIPATMKSTVRGQFITPYSPNGLTFAPVSTITDRNGRTFNTPNAWLSATILNVPEGNCSDEVGRYVDKFVQVNVGTTRITGQAALDAACGAVSGTTSITIIGG
ncbi:hypothetical protein L1D14_20550 [Vibrio tubiashii]|uniref:hypothetical protein n=1 Tax=Vibrio tubiashii TaxID=29498 RepID=UPI001EFDB6E6|nr:hypothetical protein [Vibrio tubiashii]MCG9578612.1 hypothetical protein [Vibrio tubiashii]